MHTARDIQSILCQIDSVRFQENSTVYLNYSKKFKSLQVLKLILYYTKTVKYEKNLKIAFFHLNIYKFFNFLMILPKILTRISWNYALWDKDKCNSRSLKKVLVFIWAYKCLLFGIKNNATLTMHEKNIF